MFSLIKRIFNLGPMSISAIINCSWRSVMKGMDIEYIITPIKIQKAYVDPVYGEIPDLYHLFIIDPETGISVPCCWTGRDEERCKTSDQKIQLVRGLLVNGVNCVSELIRKQKIAK